MNHIKYGLTGNMLPFCPNIVGYRNGKIPRKVKPPAINPIRANQVTFLKYQTSLKKLTFYLEIVFVDLF